MKIWLKDIISQARAHVVKSYGGGHLRMFLSSKAATLNMKTPGQEIEQR